MFQTLTQNFSKIFDKLKSTTLLSESQIDSAMRDIRISLLEADVALPVVKDFISIIKEKAKGQEVINSISPAQMVIKIIHDEMIKFLSPSENETELNLHDVPPVNLFIVGLQGSGKTTSSAKLALKLKKQNKKVLLVSLDTYRPAAQDQLKILGQEIEVNTLEIIKGQNPIEITNRAMQLAKISNYDVVIYDSAGRLHIDDGMINEALNIKKLINPTETILVIDSMIGQDATNIASNFNEKLDISSIILSRIDGDARGGAALSVRHITGKPIKFLSTGEKLTDFEYFNAKSIVSRILNMGDIISLVEKAADVMDQKEMALAEERFKKGKFDLNDYIKQIKTIRKLGGFGSMLNMIPGISKLSNKLGNITDGDKTLSMQENIVFSMTKKERKYPDLLNASRKKRISSGSGISIQQINIMLKQFKQISTMMKKMTKMDPNALKRSEMGQLLGKLK